MSLVSRVDYNRDGGHATYCLRYVVTKGELEVICDVSEGFIKKGSIVGPSIVEDVVGDLLDFPSEFLAVLSRRHDSVAPLREVAVVVPSSTLSTLMIVSPLIVVLLLWRFHIWFDVHVEWGGGGEHSALDQANHPPQFKYINLLRRE